jgi:hypothetical protein
MKSNKIHRRSRKKSTLCEKIAKNNIIEEKRLSKNKFKKLLRHHLRNTEKSLRRKIMKDPDVINLREMNFIKTCKLQHKISSKKDKSDDYNRLKNNILMYIYLLKLQTGQHNYQ